MTERDREYQCRPAASWADEHLIEVITPMFALLPWDDPGDAMAVVAEELQPIKEH
jgi:hypothetical protein